MSSTARDLITGAFRLLGVIAEGETPSNAQANDALSALNDMIDSWSNENLLIVNDVRETFTLTTGTKTYTIGTGGNFNTARPMELESALLVITDTNPNMELGIEIINLDQYNAIPLKDTQSSLPRRLYYDNAYPLGNISFYPVPDTTLSVIICSKKPLSEFATLDTVSSLAPGFMRALRFNLAIELAPEYGKEPPSTVAAIAIQSKAHIKRRNNKLPVVGVDKALITRGVGYNIYTGGVK